MERITYPEVPENMFKNLRAIEGYISNSPLDPKLLELIKLRISQKNGCAYCVDMHYKELKHLGETELRLSSLCVWEETPYFTNKETVALNFAEKLTTISSAPIANEDYDPLLAHFSKAEICYLTLAITQINTWNRLMKTFQFAPGHYKVKI